MCAFWGVQLNFHQQPELISAGTTWGRSYCWNLYIPGTAGLEGEDLLRNLGSTTKLCWTPVRGALYFAPLELRSNSVLNYIYIYVYVRIHIYTKIYGSFKVRNGEIIAWRIFCLQNVHTERGKPWLIFCLDQPHWKVTSGMHSRCTSALAFIGEEDLCI